jgi:hypothetical protein
VAAASSSERPTPSTNVSCAGETCIASTSTRFAGVISRSVTDAMNHVLTIAVRP